MANIGLHSLLSPFTTEVIEFCAMILIEQDFFGNVQHGIVDGAVCFTCEAPFFMNP